MTHPPAFNARQLRAELASLYGADTPAAARLRAAHLSAVLRLTPYTMAANLGSAGLVLWSFRDPLDAGLLLWAVALATLCGLGLWSWWRHRASPPLAASRAAIARPTWHAALLASLWALMAVVWFPGGSVGQQMTVATLVTGMLAAGGFVLNPLPRASLVYIAVFSAGALGALWRTGDAALSGVALLVGLYSPTIAIGALSAWRKSTALLQAQAQSLRQQQMLAVLLHDFEQGAHEALWETGPDGHLRHLSPRLGELLGLPQDALTAEPFVHIVERCSAPAARQLRLLMDGGKPFRDLSLSIATSRGTVHLQVSGKRLSDETGSSLGWRGVLADVTEKVRSEQLLRQMAHTDSLTGLANRFTLREQLAEAVRQQRALALLSLDLDHFKSVNDSQGHSTGDEVLRQVARRLKACVRPVDLVARLGGDEFALLLLEPGPRPAVEALARRLLASMAEPLPLGPRRLVVGASVGLTLVEAGATTGQGVDELLVQADMALYAAKAAGRARHCVYEPALGEHSRRRMAIEQGLRSAIGRGELALHWQPKIDLASGEVTGAEALMRWTSPVLGRVNPGEFVAVAEQCGAIDELGAWALDEACRVGAGALAGLTVAVNVSPLQLRDGRFVQVVREALRRHRLPPARLELEITESVFIEDADAAIERLTALRALGVRVALDDFGTGYSSLSYLRRFPFDTLKIDRAFVVEILVQQDAVAIVRMIASLASTLGMRTVCEGVETPEQLRVVSDAGCDEMQGYLVSPPCPLAEFLQLDRHWHHPDLSRYATL